MYKIFQLGLATAFFVNFIYSQTTWEMNRDIVSYDCDPACDTEVTKISIGPCFDTPGCAMPECCGIMSGTLTNISLTYVASINMASGTTHGYIVGLGVGSAVNQIQIPIPVTQVPNVAVTYDYNSCHYTQCPQEIGQTYRFDGIFTVPTTALSTLTLVANFVAQVKSDAPGTPVVVCKEIYARIVNPNFIPSIISILKNPILGGK
ncbi:hypothetical protein Bhyg_01213 [Pseudolycoriella hygida]|uniref:Uncharacterized protein n=1 Tax=Pseudolycoriella hygida TaxID=35572 RepID=A0A9Q0N991_9DIPT|nr:hypothetical protein Bhyg_01213 [Pseudolycoriella hygida]